MGARRRSKKGALALTIKKNEWVSIYDANDGAAPPIRIHNITNSNIHVAIVAEDHQRIVRSDIRGGSQGSHETTADRCHVETA